MKLTKIKKIRICVTNWYSPLCEFRDEFFEKNVMGGIKAQGIPTVQYPKQCIQSIQRGG